MCALIHQQAEASANFSFWDSRETARKDYRDADTIEVFDDAFARLLWDRIKPFFEGASIDIPQKEVFENVRWQPDLVGTWRPVGSNINPLLARFDTLLVVLSHSLRICCCSEQCAISCHSAPPDSAHTLTCFNDHQVPPSWAFCTSHGWVQHYIFQQSKYVLHRYLSQHHSCRQWWGDTVLQ